MYIPRPLLVIATAASIGVFTLATMGEASAATGKTVDIVGTQDLGAPNGEPFGFKQGRIVVHRNETVTWRNLGPEPHSISIIDQADVPQTLAQVNSCTLCEQFLSLHAPVVGENGPQPPFVAGLDRFKATAATTARLEQRGDSLLVAEHGGSYPSTTSGTVKDTVSAVITAPEGTTLRYICAIHPWMQATIKVLRRGSSHEED